MRCPDPLCEGAGPECACALRAAQPLGTFHLFRTVQPRAYPSTAWGWIRCTWYHYKSWQHEVDVPEEFRPPGRLTANDRVCLICKGDGAYGVVR